MSLNNSLGNAQKRLRMKSPEDSVEWIQNTTKMASIQIMMILVSITDDYDDEVFVTLNS